MIGSFIHSVYIFVIHSVFIFFIHSFIHSFIHLVSIFVLHMTKVVEWKSCKRQQRADIYRARQLKLIIPRPTCLKTCLTCLKTCPPTSPRFICRDRCYTGCESDTCTCVRHNIESRPGQCHMYDTRRGSWMWHSGSNDMTWRLILSSFVRWLRSA